MILMQILKLLNQLTNIREPMAINFKFQTPSTNSPINQLTIN